SGSYESGGVAVFFWNRQKLYQTVSDAKGIYRLQLPEGGYMTFCWENCGNLLEGRLEHPSAPRIINVAGGKANKEELVSSVVYTD
ncbi:MAG: hypothetical protein NT154_03580, partial [Verrucomicrobia bacterium]|nr:hypothetical protein [Verrucomicrobiota bacterium]